MQQRLSFRRTIIALLLFGAAFGYLEGAVVTYLRVLHEPARRHYFPNRQPGELFPLLTLEQLYATAPEQQHTLYIEIGREAATIFMLAAIALGICQNRRQWAAAFAITFGLWDMVFYATLKWLIGWPASLLTWDILFLIPLPWVGPSYSAPSSSLFHSRSITGTSCPEECLFHSTGVFSLSAWRSESRATLPPAFAPAPLPMRTEPL